MQKRIKRSTRPAFTEAQKSIIAQILPSMVLSPSAHNTQPWNFVVTGNTIDVFVDWSRHLTISDPSHRQLFISIGCAIENGLIAGYYWGYTPVVEFFPEEEEKDAPVARILFEKAAEEEKIIAPTLFSAIVDRRTDRNLYDGQALTSEERQALSQVMEKQPEISLIEERYDIETIAKLTEEGTVATLSRQDFKNELSHWVRNSWTRQADGMPGYAMGMPAPISLIGGIMIRFAPIHKQEGPKSYEQMNSASAILVISSSQDTPVDWLRSGQLLERIWLQLTIQGLSVAPLVSAIEASEDIRKKLQTVTSSQLLPQSLIRIGHSKNNHLKATPRRSIVDCLR